MENSRIQPRNGRPKLMLLAAVLVLLFSSARWIASYFIEYAWWKEMNQVETWFSMLTYGVAPVAACALIAAAVLWMAHARGLKQAGTRLSEHRVHSKIAPVLALVLGALLAAAFVDSWTAVRYFGGSGASAGEWRDPVFGKDLAFFLFTLPFWQMVLRTVVAVVVVSGIVYWVTARLWSLRTSVPEWRDRGVVDLADLKLTEGLESAFLRGMGVVFFLALAVKFLLGRYSMVYDDHVFMVGVDYVAENVRLPLVWISVGAAVAAAAFVWLRRWKLLLLLPLVLVIDSVAPKAVNSLYVRPNEISLQRPYIERHIQATRAAYGLNRRVKEVEFAARPETRIDPAKHKALFDNVRLWDWRAFHDTITQIQALRPYYVFADTDVDRYIINGQLRQMLLTPRELDINQLADARKRWINPHFIYTHGYGVAMAEASRITSDGLPALLIKDAPAKSELPGFDIKRPEIYYGEVAHEPVFVRTGQAEFNYPSGADNVHSHYDGKGGFPVDSLPMKLAAAVSEGNWNILLTNLLTPESRMMIRRKVVERVDAVAGFLNWDRDPYLVITHEGRLVWMLDGYTISDAHPYSKAVSTESTNSFNYIRNSVKATVDAYDGTVHLYIFDAGDPIIGAYARLFPKLFEPASAMPAGLREHARYPELIFRAQAEIYRTYHMRDPEAFYNKEDVWDLAKNVRGQSGKPEAVLPTYVVATLPNEDTPEFLLITPFTPRGKDNLIGLMVARCDGENLGEMVFLQLSKQALIFGPMQIEARINQDQNISKDLTLWNQQGSQVLRGQMLVLPIEDTFVYLEPIYIQASEARMPQLKKVALAMGNSLIYTDSYEEALAQLSGLKRAAPAAQPAGTEAAPTQTPPPAAASAEAEKRLQNVRARFQRYRDLMAQGKWAEAGKELEAVAAELNRK